MRAWCWGWGWPAGVLTAAGEVDRSDLPQSCLRPYDEQVPPCGYHLVCAIQAK